eukprot:PITA_05837
MASPMAVRCSYSLLLYILLLQSLVMYLGTRAEPYVTSRAAYYRSADGLGTEGGACGYGFFGRNLNRGDVAAVAQLYRNGTGCGACYKVRCTNKDLCRSEGVKIVVTDYGQGDRTDFIMSLHGYSKLGRPDKANQLISLGVVDIEYKRIPCQYEGYNLMFKIDSSSNFPEYLALIFWYQAGQKDVLAIQVRQEESYDWKAMYRSHGAVWDVVTPPRGALSLRFLVSDGKREEWVSSAHVIPANWKAGAIYDSGIQLN